MNDLVAQLLGEATSHIWNRLDNYLKESVEAGKGERTYNQIPTGSVNQLLPSQTAQVTIKSNGEEMGQTLQKQYSAYKRQIMLKIEVFPTSD